MFGFVGNLTVLTNNAFNLNLHFDFLVLFERWDIEFNIQKCVLQFSFEYAMAIKTVFLLFLVFGTFTFPIVIQKCFCIFHRIQYTTVLWSNRKFVCVCECMCVVTRENDEHKNKCHCKKFNFAKFPLLVFGLEFFVSFRFANSLDELRFFMIFRVVRCMIVCKFEK